MATGTDTLVVEGTLHPDGTITLVGEPQLPTGPVQVTIRSLAPARLPDPPTEDPSILPPCELPRLGLVREITPVRVDKRLPDPMVEGSD